MKQKKVCYKYNITDFPWNNLLLEGKIVWYNHQHYPQVKMEWLKDERPPDIINFDVCYQKQILGFFILNWKFSLINWYNYEVFFVFVFSEK